MATKQSLIENSPAQGAPLAAVIGKRQALCEIACLVLCIEAIMWVVPVMPDPRTPYKGLALLIVILLATCAIRDRLSLRDLGLRLDNLPCVLKRLALPLAVWVAAMVAIGLAAGTLRLGGRFYSMLMLVPVWALLQQYMLLAFINHRMRVVVGEGGPSCIATAMVFSLLHLPNPALTVACALGGFVWAREYERAPNLFANALTHAVASAFLANSLPKWMLKNMVVGYHHFFR